jgi:subtilase family serine protease
MVGFYSKRGEFLMNPNMRYGAFVAALLLASALTPPALAATQVPLTRDPGAVDLGPAPTDTVRSVAFSLTIPNLSGLKAFVASTVNPSSPSFRKFLTPDQFTANWAPSAATVAKVVGYLQSQGLTITKVHANNLVIDATGSNAQLAAVFGSPIHTFSYHGATYQRPVSTVAFPAALQGVVGSVLGLSSQPVFHGHRAVVPDVGAAAAEASSQPTVVPTPKAAVTATPGSYTVADFAARYDVTPLYAQGITGVGTTLGILTFADFDPNDAFSYWSSLGLTVDPGRITKVLVDGGSGDDAGGDETTLDVEQAGGLAPGATILVYEAPNTDAGAIDLYSQAIHDNRADTLSVSWGQSEVFNDASTLAAYEALFLEAAALGVPISAAAGDAGAYDINRGGEGYAYPTCTTLLDVDYPASDPWVLAAGGTTLAGVVPRRHGNVTVPADRAWGWDYLRPYYVTWYGQAFYYANVFPSGGGGGVSVESATPAYQSGLTGTKTSAAGQALICQTTSGVTLEGLLPAGAAGRNVPDVALDADPFTGYSLYYQGAWSSGNGGTSFVAPQLNGIFSLITQKLGGRIGQPHPQLYSLFQSQGYGPGSPFTPIAAGTNLFYASWQGFSPATGLGSLDVTNLANGLVKQ